MDPNRHRRAALLAQAADGGRRARPLPESTYRLQFHAGFTFRDAAGDRALPARPGDHPLLCLALPEGPARQHARLRHHRSRLRSTPRSAPTEDYEAWVAALHEHGLGQILDTVPNHMGVGTNDNAWWNDVLENGPASRYAPYFDIAWRSSPRPELRDKVLAAGPGRALRRRPRGRPAPPGLRRRRVLRPLLRPPVPGGPAQLRA